MQRSLVIKTWSATIAIMYMIGDEYRTLTLLERHVFGTAIDSLVGFYCDRDEDYNPFTDGLMPIEVYGGLTKGQKTDAILKVTKSLFLSDFEQPPYHAWADATMAAMIEHIEVVAYEHSCPVYQTLIQGLVFPHMLESNLVFPDDPMDVLKEWWPHEWKEIVKGQMLRDDDFTRTELMDDSPEMKRLLFTIQTIEPDYFTDLPDDLHGDSLLTAFDEIESLVARYVVHDFPGYDDNGKKMDSPLSS